MVRREVRTGSLGPFPHVSRSVFSISALLIVAFVGFGILAPQTSADLFAGAQAEIADRFGWFLTAVTNLTLVFILYIAMSRYGDIRLGAQTETPEHGFFSWVAMLFSAGIGIGLLYWGVAEPLQHYMAPPVGEPETAEAARQAMALSFLHWGVHGWAIYALVGLTLAYFHYRHGLPLSIRSALFPLVGQRIYGPIGHAVDILAVFGTIFGVVTSLGLGVMQLNAGLTVLFGWPSSNVIQLILIALITAAATVSVMLGLNAGIKRLSNLNIALSLALLAFVVALGPTLFILGSFVENVGAYLETMVRFSFWNEAYSGTDWQVDWTIFYWTWWISWSPFVGIFIARISRGRTVREFTLGVLLVPVGILLFWFTAFGGSALNMELTGDPGLVEAARASYGSAIFKLMESFPFTTAINMLILLMIVVWFVTSSDSASLVVDMLTAGGHDDPPRIQRLFWALSEGAIAAVLVVAGGLQALQAAAVVAGFPFAFVLLLMMWGLLRGFGRDKLVLYRTAQWYRTEEETEVNQPDAFRDERHLKGPPPFVGSDS